MRSVCVVMCVGVLAYILPSCSESPKASETAASYQCPACKDEVSWVYGSWREAPGTPLRHRVIKHTCPDCKKEWAAGVSQANVCEMCAKVEQKCPACAKKG